jgi:hypothetical protein
MAFTVRDRVKHVAQSRAIQYFLTDVCGGFLIIKKADGKSISS